MSLVKILNYLIDKDSVLYAYIEPSYQHGKQLYEIHIGLPDKGWVNVQYYTSMESAKHDLNKLL